MTSHYLVPKRSESLRGLLSNARLSVQDHQVQPKVSYIFNPFFAGKNSLSLPMGIR